MQNQCAFCHSELVKVDLSEIDLRVCPYCLAAYFPCDKTMAFRRCVFDKTREIWLSVLENRKADWKEPDGSECCIDHGAPLMQGNLPDYGIPGSVTTCCETFHLHAALLAQILRRTVAAPTDGLLTSHKAKRHNPLVLFVDKLVGKMFASAPPAEDPLELIQYDLKFKDILGPRP